MNCNSRSTYICRVLSLPQLWPCSRSWRLALWWAFAAVVLLCSNAVIGQAPKQLPQLIDVTHSTGIDFVHTTTDKKYFPEEVSGGVLLIDYDRDGWLDIYFTDSPGLEMFLEGRRVKSHLYRNNHDGTFTDVTDKAGVGYACEWPMGGAVADYNNDGWPDIYVTCLGRNTLYRNNGDGTFTDVTVEAGVGDGGWSTGAAFSDYDRDGWLDLVVTHYVGFTRDDLPKLLKYPLCPYRGAMSPCGPTGLPDSGISLYHNNRDGTFTEVSKVAGIGKEKSYGLGAVWSDLNNSGYPDLYIANDTKPNFLYRNDGSGHFTEIGYESGTAVSGDGSAQSSMGIGVGDYLHNGFFSIFVTNFMDEYNALYRNDGNFAFSDVSFAAGVTPKRFIYVGWGTGFFDLDNDGWPDLFLANGNVFPQLEKAGFPYRQPAFLYLNQHNGTFRDISREVGLAIQTPQVSRGVAFGDLDNDGNIDVVVENLDGPPMILHNQGQHRNNWITFELAGTKSNRLAVGARVTLVAGSLTQNDEVRSGGSYLSQNDFRVHFGLGKATRAEQVEVRWPSGLVETIKNVAVNHFYAIEEGRGLVPVESIRPKQRANSGSETELPPR